MAGKEVKGAVVIVDVDDDELFELDIALLDRGWRHGSDDGNGRSREDEAVAEDDGGDALLANCLLPASSVSKAVPVPTASIMRGSIIVVSSSPPLYPGAANYGGSSWMLPFSGVGRKLGRRGNNGSGRRRSSARVVLSGRGFETMGNFQRC
ncbi:hypothetical protein GUJ93_ZPchr0011g27025 [Zizania palustris]|uniref:Uncharacterized protein n=1 Tax=Zizania palustris TaxID=103762 RepID=A0A8J5WMM6_ZIZPA|nr:hypothetical protein GUJ93_ZPchr0011g27025 [Zizania palustris]